MITWLKALTGWTRVAQLEQAIRDLSFAAHRDGATTLVSASRLDAAFELVSVPRAEGREFGQAAARCAWPSCTEPNGGRIALDRLGGREGLLRDPYCCGCHARRHLEELEGADAVRRLGIDVPAWAAEIRAKVATASAKVKRSGQGAK